MSTLWIQLSVFVLLLVPKISAAEARDIGCQASFRAISSSGQLIEKEILMKKTFEAGNTSQYEAVLEDRFFSAVWFRDKMDFLLQIGSRDNEAEALLVRAGFDARGSVGLSEVKGSRVYRIDCQASSL